MLGQMASQGARRAWFGHFCLVGLGHGAKPGLGLRPGSGQARLRQGSVAWGGCGVDGGDGGALPEAGGPVAAPATHGRPRVSVSPPPRACLSLPAPGAVFCQGLKKSRDART